MGRRKYCSIECRQRLRYKLNMRTGLLKALNTRFATFYFTDAVIVMDVLPYGAMEIFSFFYPRSRRKKPSEDYSAMADILGAVWWRERRRTNKKYQASRLVLEQAECVDAPLARVEPLEIRIPAIKGRPLMHLRLRESDLAAPESRKIIKRAYHRQARLHHPDVGGTAAEFRKIQQAYEELMNWAEAPTFINRRGFPDKWFYDGARNRWVQPTPQKQAI